MISEREFNHDEEEDFTRDFTASPDQDYITLFIYPKGQDYDEETVGKNAARAIVELFPHNFTKTTHKTYQAVNGRNIIPKPEYSPAIRIPSDPEYQTINRSTMCSVRSRYSRRISSLITQESLRCEVFASWGCCAATSCHHSVLQQGLFHQGA